MKNLLSLIPVLAFFIAFKMAGDDPNPIVYGTKWLIGSTVAVLLLMLCIYRKLTRMELILGGAVLLFSGLTIAFDNPAFIKWKVSVMNIIYAAVLLGSRYIFRTNLLSLFMHRYLPIKEGGGRLQHRAFLQLSAHSRGQLRAGLPACQPAWLHSRRGRQHLDEFQDIWHPCDRCSVFHRTLHLHLP